MQNLSVLEKSLQSKIQAQSTIIFQNPKFMQQ